MAREKFERTKPHCNVLTIGGFMKIDPDAVRAGVRVATHVDDKGDIIDTTTLVMSHEEVLSFQFLSWSEKGTVTPSTVQSLRERLLSTTALYVVTR